MKSRGAPVCQSVERGATVGAAEGGSPPSPPSPPSSSPGHLERPLPGGVWTPGLHAAVCLAWRFVTRRLSPRCAPQGHHRVSPLHPQHLCFREGNSTQELGVVAVCHSQPPRLALVPHSQPGSSRLPAQPLAFPSRAAPPPPHSLC